MKTYTSKFYSKFISIMDFENPNSNFKDGWTFPKITKNFGKAYIDFCKASWSANDGVLSEEDFMKINGNMPSKFFNKTIKS